MLSFTQLLDSIMYFLFIINEDSVARYYLCLRWTQEHVPLTHCDGDCKGFSEYKSSHFGFDGHLLYAKALS